MALLASTNLVAVVRLTQLIGGGGCHKGQSYKNGFFFSSIGVGGGGLSSKSSSLSKNVSLQKPKSIACLKQVNANVNQDEEDEEEFEVLTAVRSKYNEIVIVDGPTSRFLLLDSTHNVHSLYIKGAQKWTGSYWDEFASLPAIVPKGPIAIYGLGGGTAAHLMLDMWPSLQLDGWEIDEILIDKARQYLELSDIEKPTQTGGKLHVHIDDALCPSESFSGSYAGIVIDLFSEGKVLTQLQEVATWLELNDRLMPNGRLMVNCGGITGGATGAVDKKAHLKSVDSSLVENSTLKALSEAFPRQLSWKRMPVEQGQNVLALTGPLPDLSWWSTLVPSCLSESVKQWKQFDPL